MPADITDHDADRVIVIGQRVSLGAARILDWSDRHKYVNDELTITALEEIALDLVRWLERNGYPALVVPTTHVDPWRYDGNPDTHLRPPISHDHAAVEAGLGTLGLNLQLLTPEYGPRVQLTAVLSSVPVEPDRPMEETLCLGPECGRCLSACPGDAVKHWDPGLGRLQRTPPAAQLQGSGTLSGKRHRRAGSGGAEEDAAQ